MKQKPINIKNENKDYEEIMKDIRRWKDSWDKLFVIEKLIKNGYNNYEEIMKEIKTWTSSWDKQFVVLELIKNGYTDYEEIMKEIKTWTSSYDRSFITNSLKKSEIKLDLSKRKQTNLNSYRLYLEYLGIDTSNLNFTCRECDFSKNNSNVKVKIK